MNMQKPTPMTFAGLTFCLAASMATATPALFPASTVRREIVYSKACAACHGDDGDGKGPGATPLNPKPRDFTRGLYKSHSTSTGELPTDADLLRIVTDGIPHSQMPSWKHTLTEQERIDVVAYIKGFSDAFKDTAALDNLTIPEPSASTPEQVSEGKHVFMTMECWSCHGTSAKGNGKAAGTLVDMWGNSIKPANLTECRYKFGNDEKSIYRTINTGLNGTPMPSFADAFLYGGDKEIDVANFKSAYSAKEVDGLLAYLKSQPAAAAVEALPEAKKNELAEQRKWALVHYVHSLIQKPSVFHWLFTEDMELTR